MTYTFKKKIKYCTRRYLKLWTNLNDHKQDIEAIKESYSDVYCSRIDIKKQWKAFGHLLSRVPSLVRFYTSFIAIVEGNIAKAKKLKHHAAEQIKKEFEQENNKIFENSNSGFLRCSAETVLI